MRSRTMIAAGSLMAALGVGIGAFAAHGLNSFLVENGVLDTFETGVRYHFYHALGLLLLGIISEAFPQYKRVKVAGLAMLIGIFIFSGSLYALCLSGVKWLGAITPIGGVGFIVAWALVAWDFFGNNKE